MWVRPLAVFVLAMGGSADAVGQGTLATVEGGAGDYAGAAVAGIGDLDFDGVPDYAIGRPGPLEDLSAGSVTIHSGFTGALLREVAGEDGDRFGVSIDGVGDIDGDGYPDLAVGGTQDADGFDNGEKPGLMRLVSGLSGETIFTLHGQDAGDALGSCVRATGDVDLDGVPDVIVGAPGVDESGVNTVGRVTVVSGSTGLTIFDAQGLVPGGGNGHAVDGGYDYNNDGWLDPVAGAYGALSGSINVYSGQTGGVIRVILGEDPGDWFGWSVAAIGDTDGDGVGDIVGGALRVGLPFYPDKGTVSLFSGADGALRYVANGWSYFGSSICGVGDVDGDGRDDIAVGGAGGTDSPVFGHGPDERTGHVRVLSGSSGEWLTSIFRGEVGSRFGSAVDGLGDINLDGAPDLIVGEPNYLGETAGLVHVLSPYDSFLPGDTLVGTLVGPNDTSVGVFHGLYSANVVLEVIVSGETDLRVECANKTWNLKGPKKGKGKKTYKLKTDTHYFPPTQVVVSNLGEGDGSFKIKTKLKPKSWGKSFSKKAWPHVGRKVHAVAGTMLSGTLTSKLSDLSDPSTLVLINELTDQAVDVASHVVSNGGVLEFAGIVLPAAGIYRMKLASAPEGTHKVIFDIKIDHPTGTSKVVLP